MAGPRIDLDVMARRRGSKLTQKFVRDRVIHLHKRRQYAEAKALVLEWNEALDANHADAHFLYPPDAVHLVKTRLPLAQRAGYRRFTIIVGRRKNTVEGREEEDGIRVAVEGWLRERGLEWQNREGNDGVIDVQMGRGGRGRKRG